MNALLAQIVTPSEGLDSALYQPLYLVMILYVVLFVLGRVFEGRDDPRADTVLDAGFALLLPGRRLRGGAGDLCLGRRVRPDRRTWSRSWPS